MSAFLPSDENDCGLKAAQGRRSFKGGGFKCLGLLPILPIESIFSATLLDGQPY